MRLEDDCPLLPHPAKIVGIEPESSDTRTFILAPDPPLEAFDRARPGQFAMLSVAGRGEAAFSFSSLPASGAAPGTVVLTIRRVGSLTGALFELGEGARVGLRGPFGRGFSIDEPAARTIYVAGGCGLSPLKAAIETHIAARPGATPLAILYGARKPGDRIHRRSLEAWRSFPGVTLIECVERGGTGWPGAVGLVTDHLAEAVRLIDAERAALCGPPAMLHSAAAHLCRLGLDPARLFIALERMMKCGIGECGHCYVDHRFVCTDGPVFSFAELGELPDAFRGSHAAPAAIC
jgi:NAD(P)H-flavin reductase